MPPSSPWYNLFQFAPPLFPFCGEASSGLLSDPIDVYSSLIYLVVGLYLLRRERDYLLRVLGYVPIIIFFGSLFFHMSFTYVGLVFDFLGIIFLNIYGVYLNLYRLQLNRNPKKILWHTVLTTSLYLSIFVTGYFYKIHSGIIMLPLLFALLFSEGQLFLKAEKKSHYKDYIWATLLISAGYVLMLLENRPFFIGCDKSHYSEWLQMHTFWHILSAVSFVYVHRFYKKTLSMAWDT